MPANQTTTRFQPAQGGVPGVTPWVSGAHVWGDVMAGGLGAYDVEVSLGD